MFVMLMACYIQSLNYKLANESLSFRNGAAAVSFFSGICSQVTGYSVPDVSKEHSAFNFKGMEVKDS
jgi:hypothetical protein